MSAPRDGVSVQEMFAEFFERWLEEQNQNLQSLVSAAKEYENKTGILLKDTSMDVEEQALRSLVNRVLQHYESYYQVKEARVKEDVLAMSSPSWRSTLEDAFLWIGGWRPSMAFHLLYSKSVLQVQSHLQELMQGLGISNLGGLSGTQMTKIDELHRVTIRKERDISEKFAKHQESVADISMVELSNLVSEAMRNEGTTSLQEEQVESTLQSKEAALQEIIRKADDLRLETLKAIVGILTPIQAAHYLIAAAELHLRLHEWGKKRDEDKHQAGNSTRTNQPL